jgi:light-regulated signal transduction histidine kinase (bacteriophytochrome)
MEAAAAVAVDAVGLAACDSEPIHIAGSIQPYGMLLALARGGYRCCRPVRTVPHSSAAPSRR